MNFDAETVTEREAHQIFFTFARRFGWTGAYFTRADAEQEWENQVEVWNDSIDADSDDEKPIITTLPDEAWEEIINNVWWKQMPARFGEDGNALVEYAVREALDNYRWKPPTGE